MLNERMLLCPRLYFTFIVIEVVIFENWVFSISKIILIRSWFYDYDDTCICNRIRLKYYDQTLVLIRPWHVCNNNLQLGHVCNHLLLSLHIRKSNLAIFHDPNFVSFGNNDLRSKLLFRIFYHNSLTICLCIIAKIVLTLIWKIHLWWIYT